MRAVWVRQENESNINTIVCFLILSNRAAGIVLELLHKLCAALKDSSSPQVSHAERSCGGLSRPP
ncbi:hypothetical protein [Bradyrhizobium sp. BR 1432]|uniref:hypothetical protein n=1 Tax=Bradyrhizobium sp. BR 1432 TaxID=3447966 RepID=UPI003EE6C159